MQSVGRTHGGGLFSKLLVLILIFFSFVSIITLLWLLISFPLWWPDAPRISLPFAVMLSAGIEGVFNNISFSSELLQSIEFRYWRGDLNVLLINPWHQWFYILFAFAGFCVVVLNFHFLHKVVKAISCGQALNHQNANYLKWAGLLMILLSVYFPALSIFTSFWLLEGLIESGNQLSVDWISEIEQGSFISGWILLTVSEAVRQGSELQDEQVFTI